MPIDIASLELVYCGDPWDHRTKTCGLNLIDQLLISIETVRENWSSTVGISFIHTLPLSNSLERRLCELQVKSLHAGPSVCDTFPMANKILPGRFDFSGKNVLFLDCDTKVHLPVEFDDTQGIYVAYDALQTLPKDVFELVFKDIAVPLPAGNFVSCPSFEYYYNDNTEFFPIWNAGVYYLRNDLKASFYERYLRNFLDIHERHFNKEWRFYIEQLAFTAAALQLGTPVSIFPKGINFICTPRANQLKEWPADKIIIEHYAGDTSRPLAFNGTKIVEY